MNKHCLWDKAWSSQENDDDFWRWVRREAEGARGRKITAYIKRHLGNINGLKTIEAGSGAGVYSLIFSRYGAAATLLDYSKAALEVACRIFDSAGLSASFVHTDALHLAPGLLGKFDVAMSFGTVEHFRDPERFLMAKAHFDLVRPGGIVIISVPNRWFFLYEILQFYLQKKGKWQLGYSQSFASRELFQLGKKLGLEDIAVRGSAFIVDIVRFIYLIQNTHLLKGLFRSRLKQFYIRDLSSPFDDLFGADIFLMGFKPYENTT